jgi:hypothetical protein
VRAGAGGNTLQATSSTSAGNVSILRELECLKVKRSKQVRNVCFTVRRFKGCN